MTNPDLNLDTAAQTECKCRRVLILESDRLFRTLLAEWLEIAGYEAVQASAAADVLYGSKEYDLVLADVPAPLKSARHMLLRIAQILPSTPLIAMSADMPGCGRSACDALARDLGAAAVLVKPFSQDTLLEIVNQVTT
jgi:DNA-binding response OmpR family regulator